jgi:hypothetical protein
VEWKQRLNHKTLSWPLALALGNCIEVNVEY